MNSYRIEDIFIKKTCYVINNQRVETTVIAEEQPTSIIQTLKNFESGQVYEVLFRNVVGEFVSINQLKKSKKRNSRIDQILRSEEDQGQFLIYIVNQHVKINDTPQTLTFFKDITFGVLYEQIKAQHQLKDMLDNTLQDKIGYPLQSVVKTCQNVLQSNQLAMFEEDQIESNPLRKKLDSVVIQCKSMLFKLYDLQDWKNLVNGSFRKRNVGFDLGKTIQRIKSIMVHQA